MFTKRASRGEWWNIGMAITDPTTNLPIDVSSCSVTLTVRNGPKSTDQAATVVGSTTGIVDGPGGIVSAGGRIATPAIYYATISADRVGSPAGWPVMETAKIVIEDCP